MIIRCAWCKAVLGDKPPYDGEYADMITDTICEACMAEYFPEAVSGD